MITKNGYNPIPDGCGANGLILSFQNTIYDGFENCCGIHDVCYGQCETLKQDCDHDFFICLNQFCEQLSTNSTHYSSEYFNQFIYDINRAFKKSSNQI